MWKSVVFLLCSISCSQANLSKKELTKNVDNIYLGLGPNKLSSNAHTNLDILKIIADAEKLTSSSIEEIRKIEQMFEENKKEIVRQHYEKQRLANQTKTRGNGNIRVKRQAGGKFAEAAKVDNLKMLRIYLTIMKNLFADSAVGGVHPFDEDVPKPVVLLFKQKIIDFFFPPVGGNSKV